MTIPTTSAEIRQAFLDFFEEQRHTIVPSSPLPNRDNPTLLFTNAGMNQFVNVFLGKEKRPYSRAATAQKVMRVQGKQNDLENVGPSPRHHTMFEMLGNFSFGDYFKEQAINFAWLFLTGVLKLEKERLWVTIYTDDDEAEAYWRAHVAPERILRFGKEDNFWEMGETGPCGPCSEIHYYTGDLARQTAAGVNVDDAYLEVWNLVFMQYDRDQDGVLHPLPNPSIDTGMGLERIAQVRQGVSSNFDTDLFLPLMRRTQELAGHSDEERLAQYVAYRVIADHGRAATFLIGDGVLPGNVGEGYVLRMIIRRAMRFGRKIGLAEPFLAEIAQVVAEKMGEVYPELRRNLPHIQKTLTQEEVRFMRTLDSALARLDGLLQEMEDAGISQIPGDVAFTLYATYGLPMEITRDVAGERGLTVDVVGFEAARQAHAQASGAGAFNQYQTRDDVYGQMLARLVAQGRLPASGVDHDPYTSYRLEAEILGLLAHGKEQPSLAAGSPGEVVCAATPFYVESGGEVSDTGRITLADGQAEFRVDNVHRPVPGLIVHSGELVSGQLRPGQVALLQVDNARRADIRRNHTATHILHRELRAHLGRHVTQAGSLVAPDRLRFDFTHDQAVDQGTLAQIEAAINQAILANFPISVSHMKQREAIDRGAMALFGEKYGDIVRTICIGNCHFGDHRRGDHQGDHQGDHRRGPEHGPEPYSFELCGGLHVSQTGEIGLFRFTAEGAVAAGIRRVEAVTGRGAQALVARRLDMLERLSRRLSVPVEELEDRLSALLEEHRALQKELDGLRRAQLLARFDALMAGAQRVSEVNVLAARLEGTDAGGLRQLVDRFRDRAGSGVVVLATVSQGRPVFVAGVTDDLVTRGVHAGNLVRQVASIVGGGGGGRPHLAQAGGRDPARLPQALAAVPGLVTSALSGQAGRP